MCGVWCTEEGEEKPTAEECGQYEKFWKQYGKSIKLGIMEDATNRNRLAKLLRFHTSSSPDKLVSLEEYVERMKDGQKQIYFLAGEYMRARNRCM
jgi:heat shock protein 90kDa beta